MMELHGLKKKSKDSLFQMIIGNLGKGSFGEVCQITDLQTRKVLAVKTYQSLKVQQLKPW